MEKSYDADVRSGRHDGWNKGKMIGPKPPLLPKIVWAIRTRLQIAQRKQDLSLFNLAIDTNLCDCDLVTLKLEDVEPWRLATS